jgi:hypothetical protein
MISYCSWSAAVQVTARAAGGLTWQVVHGRYDASRADPNADVSPLRGLSREYADAMLQIVTAPVRMLEDRALLGPRPATVQIVGQWYLPIDAKYKEQADTRYWTQGIYFQTADRSLVDMVWLGNPLTHKFLVARGYDYTPSAGAGVLIPTKIEVFESDPTPTSGRVLPSWTCSNRGLQRPAARQRFLVDRLRHGARRTIMERPPYGA